MVSALWNSSVVDTVLVSEDFEVMRCILKYSAGRLYLSKEEYGISITKKSYELTGYEEFTESSSVDIYIYIYRN